MRQIEVVENGLQAKEKMDMLLMSGFTKDDIYLFAHDKNRSEHLTENTDTSGTGMKEQGFFSSVGNLFRSRGDELRSKMQSLGLSESEADAYEKMLDEGKVVMIASKKTV
ncbi:general stress protein [Bacillus sp. M6-12]|uniref:general stress protein n=1 Tax=Bacillus sp. M6-12 TaxID=2054166 RepID=UPI000C79134A|nr:general stress protein [Bacillus sp. M6-12]PLS18394.1 general stress protein [Bacillus sp. M6-12]